MLHEQKFKGFPSSKWQDRIDRSMLDLESQGPGSIPTGGKYHCLFYNPNLHNIARSGRIRFKMKNPIVPMKNGPFYSPVRNWHF